MRRILFLLALSAGVLVLGTGCAGSGYFASRGRDAADIFTLTLGTGFGVKARIGPVQPAILMNHDITGLRAGEGVYSNLDEDHNWEIYFPVPISDKRGTCGIGYYNTREIATKRGKQIREISPIPLVVVPDLEPGEEPTFDPQYTQIEVAGGAILTVRAGFNIGEFLDFLLGWFTVDLYDDDF